MEQFFESSQTDYSKNRRLALVRSAHYVVVALLLVSVRGVGLGDQT